MSRKLQRFERAFLPHMEAAFALAYWLLQNGPDAEDAVQEAYLRAFKAFDRYAEGNSRAWILTILRNLCYRRLRERRRTDNVIAFDEALHSLQTDLGGLRGASRFPSPEAVATARSEQARTHAALAELAPAFREVLVLRELEELSYREIAEITGVPLGTVMSRLARARCRLRDVLLARQDASERERPA